MIVAPLEVRRGESTPTALEQFTRMVTQHGSVLVETLNPGVSVALAALPSSGKYTRYGLAVIEQGIRAVNPADFF